MKKLSSVTISGGLTVDQATTLSGVVSVGGIGTGAYTSVLVRNSSNQMLYRNYSDFVNDISGSLNLSGYVPTSRTLTINGTTYDLSADRTWTISTVDYTSRLQHQVKAGVAINKGQAVYVTSADGTNMIVGLASNASEATSSKTMGLLDATVTTNGFANVVTEGLLAGLDTSTAGAEGDPVWLGTGGNLIYGLANKPYAPAHLVFIGIVTRKNANNGEIFVKVQNGFELNEIHDVDIKTTVPVNGHILGFDGTLWVNKTIAGWLGYTPANASGTTNYISKFTGSTTLGNSQIFDNGTNVGIGTTSPVSKLHVIGNISLDRSRYIFFGGEGSTGEYIYEPTPGTIAIHSGGSDSMVFPNTGIVYTPLPFGIGTTSPSYKLDVATGNDNAIRILNSLGSNNNGLALAVGSGTPWMDFNGSSFSIKYNPNPGSWNGGANNHFTILSGGNVGIGTTSPSYKLDISGALRATGTVYSDNGSLAGALNLGQIVSIGSSFGSYANLIFTMHNGGGFSDIMKLQGNGNVGIGTNSPTNRLQIGSIGSSGYGGNDLAIGNGTQVMAFYQSATVSTWYTNTSFSLMPSGSGSVGNVGIGTTSPGAKLHVVGNTYIESGVLYVNTIAGYSTNLISIAASTNVLVPSGDITIGSGASTSTTQPFGDFSQLKFDNLHSDTNRGPNKIVMHDNGGSWIGGFGIHSDTVSYYTGGHHRWYKTDSQTSSSQVMQLDPSGNLTLAGTLSASGYNKSNWDTAYSWGNHASAGYLTSYSETDTLASVTNRGNSTTNRINVRGIGNQSGGNIMMGDVGEGTNKWSYLTGTHYNASSQPQGFALIGGLSTDSFNAVVIGGNIYETNPATEIQFWTHSATTHNLGGTQRGVINSAGNWGIGTTSPNYKLDVNGFINIFSGNGLRWGSGDAEIINSGWNLLFKTYNGSVLSEAMRINSAGKVSIGTTDTNSDKSDFTVYTGGNTSIALAGNLFRVGESDINWDIALRSNGFLETYAQPLYLRTIAGSQPVVIGPNGTNTVEFYPDYTLFNGLNLAISRTNSTHGATNYFRGDASHLVIGTGGTLYLNYGGSTTIVTGNATVSGYVGVTGIVSANARKLSLGILDLNTSGVPGQFKIKTSIPWNYGGSDFTVNIKGFRYGSSQMVSLSIGWHFYNNEFYSRNAICNGAWGPTITLAKSPDGYVIIHLPSPNYWAKLYVESVYSSNSADSYTSGWSWSDADLSDCTLIQTVPYKDLATNISGNAATATFATTAGALSSMNISQFTNNSGYITSYTETDTLQSVTSRGATTNTLVSLNAGLRMGNAYLTPSGDQNHFHFDGTAIIPNSSTTANNASIGTNTYRWSSVYGGYGYFSENVGIGTTSPATKFHVHGYTTIDSVDVVATFSSDNTAKRVNIGYSTSGDYGFINAVHTGVAWKNLIFGVNGGNIGIGLTNPTAILHTSGNTKLGGGTLQVSTDQTFLSNYSYTFRDAVGINNPNSLSAASATTVMSIGSMTNGVSLITTGSIGVGTTSPNRTLSVNGIVGISSGTANTQQLVFSVDSGASYITSSYFGSSSYVPMYLETGGNVRLAILTNGNVGIGITTPVQKLDVNGNISLGSWTKPGSTYVGLRRADDGSFGGGGDSGLVIESYNHASPYTGDYSQKVHLRTHLYNGGSHNVLTAYGLNVGIGTTSPYSLLQVGNPEQTTPAELTIASRYDGGGPILNFRTDHPDNDNQWNMARIVATDDGNYNGRIEFRTTNSSGYTGVQPTTKMVIKATGNVGIGISSPSEKLHVSGASIFDGGSGNSSTDAVVYITKSTNDDWGLYVNNAGLDYGMYTRTSPSANYAFAIHNGTTWTTRITGNAIIYLGEKDAIRGNSDSWLRLNNSNDYTSGVYTPGVMRADGGFNVSGNTVWHAANDGSGSGLDADTVDGVQADSIVYGNARGTNDSVTTNNNDLDKTGYYTSDSFATKPSGVANWMYIEHIKLYNANTAYQKQLGYDTYDDRMWVRTKSGGAWSSWKQIWTSDSLTNLSQLTNGPGYITSSALSGYATTSYVTTQINNLINGAPGALDTLDELAAALGDDANFATTVTNSIAGKLPLAGGTMSGSINMNGNNVINIGQVNATHAIFTNDGSSRVMYLRGSGNIIQFQDAAANNKWEVVGRDGEFYVYKNDGSGSGYRWKIDSVGNHAITGAASFSSNINVAGELAFPDGGGAYSNIIRSAAYPSEGYPAGLNFWMEYRAKGGHHFILNTDGGVGAGLASMDDFVIWQGAIDGNRLLEVSNIGNLWIAGALTEASSFKLKENVETSKGNLEKVVNLRPVTYNKIGSQTTELGLIAEEVAEVYPEFVQYDENGEPVGVHYSRLTAALIGAVKELTNQVQELNKKING